MVCYKWLSVQYGPTPVSGDGGVRTTRRSEPENAGAHPNLEYGDATDSLCVRDGRVRDRRLGSRLFATGESSSELGTNRANITADLLSD
jgi:hypothetical protein